MCLVFKAPTHIQTHILRVIACYVETLSTTRHLNSRRPQIDKAGCIMNKIYTAIMRQF